MAMLPRLKPQHFYDLVVEVAIVRPGPIQGDMVHPYLRRRQGIEPVTYPSAEVRKVLERTLGIPIFQEQVIELAMVAAGFSAGEADQLRRAMAAWRRRGGLEVFEQKLIDGMLARGHDEAFAQRVFRQIQGFGEYGFPESHAASFALLVYVSAWLKRHEPAAFYCGLLNSLPMGFYSPSQLIQDARRHEIEVLPVDVQHSGWDHRLQPDNGVGDGEKRDEGKKRDIQPQPALRLGLRLVKGFDEDSAHRIEAQAPFKDVDDLASRAGLNEQQMRFLARSDALRTLSGHRYQAHWDGAGIQPPLPLQRSAQQAQQAPERPDKVDAALVAAEPRTRYRSDIQLEQPSEAENIMADYRYLSLSLRPHPMVLLRSKLDARLRFGRTRNTNELSQCRQGQLVRVGGVVTGRQRPSTATGVLFVTLEDEAGNMNIVVWSSILQRFRAELLQGELLLVKGVVEREHEVIHVVAGVVENHTDLLATLGARRKGREASVFRSRNFR